MAKQAPSVGRILVAVGFTLSCFALLLFLWVTFGGPVPFKPASYRFTADFPEAITLSKEADVRIQGGRGLARIGPRPRRRPSWHAIAVAGRTFLAFGRPQRNLRPAVRARVAAYNA